MTNNNPLTSELNINGKTITVISREFNSDVASQFKTLCELVTIPAVTQTIKERPAGALILYSVKDELEFHLQGDADTIKVLDCFSNKVRPFGKCLIIVVEADGKVSYTDEMAVLKKDVEKEVGVELSMKDLFNATSSNRLVIKVKAQRCGCFHCKQMFESSEIKEYVTEVNGTESAICPYCGVDMVIPENLSPAPISEALLSLINTD